MVRDVSLLKNINFFKCPRSYQPYTKDMIENSYKSKEDYLDDRSYLTLQDVYNLLSDHLCLVHGFIWNNTGLIKNYYKFYKGTHLKETQDESLDITDDKKKQKKQNLIGLRTSQQFHKVGFEVKPTKDLTDHNKHPELVSGCGFFVGLMLFKYILSEEYIDHTFYISIEKYQGSRGKENLNKVHTIEGQTNYYNQSIFYIGLNSKYKQIISLLNNRFKFNYTECFHLFLAYVWWICGNENGIIQYYTGLKESFQYITAFINDYHIECTKKKNDREKKEKERIEQRERANPAFLDAEIANLNEIVKNAKLEVEAAAKAALVASEAAKAAFINVVDITNAINAARRVAFNAKNNPATSTNDDDDTIAAIEANNKLKEIERQAAKTVHEAAIEAERQAKETLTNTRMKETKARDALNEKIAFKASITATETETSTTPPREISTTPPRETKIRETSIPRANAVKAKAKANALTANQSEFSFNPSQRKPKSCISIKEVTPWSDSLYVSLMRLFNPENIVVPSSDRYEKYKMEDIKKMNYCKDWLQSLVISYLNNISELPIYSYETTAIEFNGNITYFSDCGETSVRNFLNICFYNGESFKVERDTNTVSTNTNTVSTNTNTAFENIKEFYKVFKTFEDQSSSTKKEIFGKELTSYEAWAVVVSNLNNLSSEKNIVYVNKITDGEVYEFEIESGCDKFNNKSNIFSVISILLGIKYESDLETFLRAIMPHYGIELVNVSVNEQFYGEIEFKKNGVRYVFYLEYGHYYIDAEPIKYNVLFDKDVGDTHTFFSDNICSTDITENLMIIKHRPENLFEEFNDYRLNKTNSYLIFNYIDKYYPNERHKLCISLSRIHPAILKHNLKPYGFKYNGTLIKEIYCLNPIEGDFPEDIDTVNIRTDIYGYGQLDFIPNTVSTLIIDDYVDITVVIPDNVKTLKFSGRNYSKLKIPSSVTSLILLYSSDLLVILSKLAENVSTLVLLDITSDCDTSKLSTVLQSLKNLKNLVLNFINEDIQYMFVLTIPNGIETLTLKLPTQFNSIVPNFQLTIPDTVTTLAINLMYSDIKLLDIIPKNVTNLTVTNSRFAISRSSDNPKLGFDSTKIETLTLESCVETVDSYTNLKTLSLIDMTDTAIGTIPDSVTTLIYRYCKTSLEYINNAKELKTLHIEEISGEEISGEEISGEDTKLPNTITALTFSDDTKLPENPSFIPESVTELNLGSCYELDLSKVTIPQNVKKLTFGYNFNQKLTSKMIPETVTELNLPHEYEHDLNEISIPGRKINQDYRSFICDLQLPDNVKKDILMGLNKPIC